MQTERLQLALWFVRPWNGMVAAFETSAASLLARNRTRGATANP
jgi:hypothetical protein